MTALFDRRLLRQRRDRAARQGAVDFLFAEVTERLMERLDIVKRVFPCVLDLGCAHGQLSEKLKKRQGTAYVVGADSSFSLAKKNANGIVADAEMLPFKVSSFDAIVSNLDLHWVNDLPGALIQIRQILKPDGLFLAAMLGGESLKELRQSMMEAEVQVTGGASPRVSPFADLRDMGGLMQRAGFALPVVDSDVITVDYSHPLKLMQDLRGMGASNATYNRLLKPTRRAVIMEAANIYQKKFSNDNQSVSATFQVIYMIGWSPHESQQQPLKPGSAKARLADALKVREVKVD